MNDKIYTKEEVSLHNSAEVSFFCFKDLIGFPFTHKLNKQKELLDNIRRKGFRCHQISRRASRRS